MTLCSYLRQVVPLCGLWGHQPFHLHSGAHPEENKDARFRKVPCTKSTCKPDVTLKEEVVLFKCSPPLRHVDWVIQAQHHINQRVKAKVTSVGTKWHHALPDVIHPERCKTSFISILTETHPIMGNLLVRNYHTNPNCWEVTDIF